MNFRRDIKFLEWKTIYPKRFSTEGRLSFGKFFSVDYDLSSSVVTLKKNVSFRNFCHVRSGMDSKLTIGENVFFNNGCSITCLSEITIGNDCQFGENVKFYDHNHQYSKSNKLINLQGYTFGSIRIGNNCWFGSDVIVLKGVEIGDNVVIGAGCILYKSIPAGSIIVNKQNLSGA